MTSKIRRYPKQVLDLLHPEGFNKKFEELFTKMEYDEAYFNTEELHEHWFGFKKYRNIESFRKAREYHLKKRKPFLY